MVLMALSVSLFAQVGCFSTGAGIRAFLTGVASGAGCAGVADSGSVCTVSCFPECELWFLVNR